MIIDYEWSFANNPAVNEYLIKQGMLLWDSKLNDAIRQEGRHGLLKAIMEPEI